ncbi:sugar phosphate isomerase/epimerase family protein [Methanocaldococcus sp.]
MIGICIRGVDVKKFKDRALDIGLHYCKSVINGKNVIGYHAPILNLEDEKNIDYLKNLIKNLDGDYLTIHINRGEDEVKEEVIENLKILNSLCKKLKIKLCIENLRRGFSSNPKNILKVADEVGCYITFDIGHVPYGKRLEFIDVIGDKIYNCHFYEIEKDGKHIAPKDLRNLREVIDKLLDVKCNLYLIELMKEEEIKRTERLLREYLLEVGKIC